MGRKRGLHQRQHQPAGGVSQPSWKQALQETAARANIVTLTSGENPSQNHPAKARLNSRPTDIMRIISIYYCVIPYVGGGIVCYAAIAT